ncbi:MAG: hypothetical protein ACI9Y1_002998 [Lentisphaeria bacterium]|jgi:hypothetical protein
MLDIITALESIIQETEHYYREMIFSSGCSSMVPIYRITKHATSEAALIRQLDGPPYIQKDIPFSARVVEALTEVDLYIHHGKHMFLESDIKGEIATFVEQCTKVESFDKILAPLSKESSAKDFLIDESVETLISKYPVLQDIDLRGVLSQIEKLSREINFGAAIDGYLQVFQHQDWAKKHELNRSSLICMVSIANQMGLSQCELKELLTLGLLKDIGYARLQDFIQDFEVMHPLVSHKVVIESNNTMKDDTHKVSQNVLNAILLHHEFTDSSGPLARMRHPVVTEVLQTGMPIIAQISGICDLYLGFFEKYNPAEAFAITCGYVLGQGDVKPRYEKKVIEGFIADFRNASHRWGEENSENSATLVKTILETLRDGNIQKKAADTINNKTQSRHERITLALNLVRNIARKNPQHIGEKSLVQALHLPIEFGLNYD